MGVMRRAGICGWTRDPPAESEYAVDPVGVDTVRPSAWTVVRWCSSPGVSRDDGGELTEQL
jgi:hypothetical protein